MSNPDDAAIRAARGVQELRRYVDRSGVLDIEPLAFAWAEIAIGDPDAKVRMAGTYCLGEISATSPAAMMALEKRVSRDPDWRVQEMLAKAFDSHCQHIGYEASLPLIDEWLASAEANVRRAVTEGLRIWTRKPYFDEHPQAAVGRLKMLEDDPSPYVRKSVSNALRDIVTRGNRDGSGIPLA